MNDIIEPDESENVEQNQQVTGKVEKNPFILALDEVAVEHRLQKLFNINPKTWNDWKDSGKIPRIGTYKEFLVAVFAHYKNQNDVALRKLELKNNTHDKNVRSFMGENGSLEEVVEAEKMQKIRLDRAREQQIHMQNLQTRSQLVHKGELLELISPLIGNIINVLRNAADQEPKLQNVIDQCFISLHAVGQEMLAQVDKDSESYLEELMETPVDLQKLINGEPVELM